jgi:FtsH-binding integral membrane protein
MWPYFSNVLIAGNVGIMVFFTVAVAPTLFTVLPPEWSAAYVRKFFPRYFFFLGLTTAAATLSAFTPTRQAALLACTVIFFFSCFWLTPRINRARDGQKSAAFKRLHWASVGLNMAQLVTFVWLLLPFGYMA